MMKTHLTLIFSYLSKKLSKFLRFIKFVFVPRSRWMILGLIFVIASSVFIYGHSAFSAGLGDKVLGLVNQLLFLVAYALGWLAMKIFALIIWVSSYNDFVTSPAVSKGWILIRDSCNMIFVIILLIIAFAQILGVQKYSIKILLPKVLIAAIVVNFSKLICGLIIDFSQVVMLTFVNGYKATAGANLLVGLGLTKLLKLNEDATSDQTVTGTKASEITLALVLAIIMIICTIFVSFFIALLLLVRIVTLWILVVLSPAAFMVSTVPFGTSYAGRWWKEFGNAVAIGPFMAFFLWLSLLIMSNPEEMMPNVTTSEAELTKAGGSNAQSNNPSQASYVGNIAQFAIGLAMLLASLKIATEMGGVAGQIASKTKWGNVKKNIQAGAKRLQKAKTNFEGRRDAGKMGRIEGALYKGGLKVKSQVKRVAAMPKAAVVGGTKGAFKGGIAGYKAAKAGGGGILKQAKGLVLGAGKGTAVGTGAALKEQWQRRTFGGSTDKLMENETIQTERQTKRAEAKKRFAAMGIETPDQYREVMVNGTKKSDRAEAALQVAEAGKFQSVDEVKQARKDLKGDKEGEKALADSLKKKQAHLAYDLSDPEKAKKFREDVKNGDIDVTKQQVDAYKDPAFMREARASLGSKAFGKKMKDVADRSAEHKDAVSGTLKDVAVTDVPKMQKDIDDANAAKTALPATATPAEKDAADKKVKDLEKGLDDFRKAVANITGDLGEAFGKRDTTAGSSTFGQVVRVPDPTDPTKTIVQFDSADRAALASFVKGASGKDLGKMKVEDDATVTIAQNVTVQQMSSMATSGESDAQDNVDKLVASLAAQAQTAKAAVPINTADPTYAALKKAADDLVAKVKKIAANQKITDALSQDTTDKMNAV